MKWEAKIIKHRGESRIAVHFEKDANMIARIKQFEESTWSTQLKVWHLPDTEENRVKFKLATASSLLPSEEGIFKLKNSNNGCDLNDIASVPLTHTKMP